MKRKAQDLEREILAQSSEGSRHLAEERNQIDLRDSDRPEEDEEALYSDVIREDKNQKYSSKKGGDSKNSFFDSNKSNIRS